MNTYTNARTGFASTDLTAVVDASTKGDTISYQGQPWGTVTNRGRIDFVKIPRDTRVACTVCGKR